MPEYLSPGVYVEEIDTGNKPIEGVSTSTAGMLGVTERGPVDVPILITSYGEYRRWFGERLPHDDFFNPASGPHCYLPHAVEGFFQNEGQRVYVTRVLDRDNLIFASEQLFDGGTAASPSTLILRAAGEDSGTAANPPLLYVLDPTGLNVSDWVRVGDGSPAEYRQIAAINAPANNTHVPLSFALNFAHEQGQQVQQFTPTTVANGYLGTFQITADTAAGAIGFVMSVPLANAADVTNLLNVTHNAPPYQLIEIGGPQREYHFIRQVTALDPLTVRVVLEAPLTLAFAQNTTVTPLTVPIVATHTQNLALAGNAGDALIFLDTRGGFFNAPADLVLVSAVNADHAEVRRIGRLAQLTVSPGAAEPYAADSIVEKVDILDSPHLAIGALAGAGSITLDDVAGLQVGDNLMVDPGVNQEPVTVQSIAANNVVNFQPVFVNPHPMGPGNNVTVVTSFSNKTLTAAASAGSRALAVDNRRVLQVGDVIRIGTAPNDEYATVVGLPDRAATPPDAGTVVIDHPLQLAHAAGDAVHRQSPPVVDTANPAPPTTLVLEALTGGTQWIVSDGQGYGTPPLQFIRITIPSGDVLYHRIVATTVVNPVEIGLTAPPPQQPALERAHGAGSVLVERAPLIDVEALDPGSWGNRLRISVEDENPGLVSRARLTTIANPTHVRFSSVAGIEAGTVLELLDPLNKDAVVDVPLKVVSIDRASNYTVVLAGVGLTAAHLAAQANAVLHNTALGVRSREFRLTVLLMHQPDPSLPSRSEQVVDSEMFRNLSMDPRHSRYFQTVLGDIRGPLRREDRRPEGESWYVRVHDLAQDLIEPTLTNTLESIRLGPERLFDILPSGQTRPARRALEHGDDSIATITDDTYIGLPNINPEARTGLYSFTTVDEISIVSIPGRTGPAIQGALIDHCELDRYRFAVLDGPAPPEVWPGSNDSLTDVQFQRQQFDTKYAALYYPWVVIEDPFPVNPAKISNVPIPPSGHVLGVYARTDIERGVHKAPANEVVRGILGLQRLINKQEQDILNPSPVNINVIRDFRNNERGIRVWGGRVITSDTDWKYVNVRRLLIFIEKSIDRGLQWVVFEPNAEPLWARVRRTIGNFLTTVWRNGGLEGTKPEEAYFVKCDRTTMTQTDIDNGKLIVVIGVAPVKPAEFVIIRIGLWTAHAES